MAVDRWPELCASGLDGFCVRASLRAPLSVIAAMKHTVNKAERKADMHRCETADVRAGQGVKSLLNGWLRGSRANANGRVSAYQGTDAIVECAAKSGTVYRYRVASDLAARERAYRFAHEIYSGVSLAQDNGIGMVVSPYDAGPETITLLAEDSDGGIGGTVSLVFDSGKKMPCDEIFWVETERMRADGRAMAEVTRLALRKDCEDSRDVLLRLFNLIYIYARRVRGYTDFVIEVHPRHLKYYERALGFKAIGDEQKCPRVGGAPAVLGQLDLSMPDHKGRWESGRTLYPRFWSETREPDLADAMAEAYRPMAEHEAEYFGVEPMPTTKERLAS